MLLLVGGPIVTLLIALAPDTRQASNQQAPTNASGNRTQLNQLPAATVDGINRGDAVAETDQRSEQYANELLSRATLAQEAQARWARWQGVAGIVGLFGALGLLLYTHYTLRTTATAADTANKALIMGHRPKLMVRHVVVDGFMENGAISDKLTNGYVWLTNVGAFNLTLVKFHHQWLYARALPMENPALKAIDNTTKPVVMTPASFVEMKLDDRPIDFREYKEINDAVDGMGPAINDPAPGTLYLIGYVKYQDTISLRRRYFCFKYDTTLHYFTPVEHPSYSYED